MSLMVGITGGIGSGKTTVCKIFEKLGIPVYYADARAKYLMTNSPEIVDTVKKIFGKESFDESGNLNRTHIAKLAFSNPDLLSQLNQTVHPAVHADGKSWHEAQKDVPYTLNEAALMVESGGHKRMNKLIVVVAPEDLRIERVMKRDGVDEKAVRARMDNQLPQEEKEKLADFIINNDGSESLILQVWKIHAALKKAAQASVND
ncbi:MAG: dephospho-CoA kinase [Saprospiraceae bacterium]